MSDQAEPTRPQTRDKFPVVNPATGEPGLSYDPPSREDAAG